MARVKVEKVSRKPQGSLSPSRFLQLSMYKLITNTLYLMEISRRFLKKTKKVSIDLHFKEKKANK